MLVGVTPPDESRERTLGLLEELRELVRTLEIGIELEKQVAIRETRAKYFVGAGKAESLMAEARDHGCDAIVFDNELTPAQQRNWERLGEDRVRVIDRQEVILDIFGERAQTREASLQVELARMEYNLPRLKRAWTHLHRQRGGGAIQRDAGETQLELDQRMIRSRIARLKAELRTVVKQRETQRKRRRDVPVPTAAIVGYTNAGKSSLINRLTGASIAAEDKLFATLDPTSRRCKLPSGQTVVITDTVGFVRNLPHRLVDAFKATLEEAVVSDFLIQVLDLTSPDVEAHAETTRSVLRELGADEKRVLTVFNKVDQTHDPALARQLERRHPGAMFVSATSGEGVDALRESMDATAGENRTRLRLLIPHDRYDLVARLHREGGVQQQENRDDGVLVVSTIPERIRSAVAPFVLSSRVA